MAKTILINLKSTDNASANIKKTEKAVTDLGKKSGEAMKATTHGASEAMGKLDALGNRFRYMSIVVGALAVGSVALMKGFVDAAREMEAATLRLGVFAESTGQSLDKAKKIALELAGTGLVSVTEASNSLSNLMATGLNLDTADVLLRRMLDTAVLSKESLTDTFGKALEKSTLGIRILQERQVDAIGINFRADQVWRAYGKTIGKTTAQMSTQEKQMAIVNFLMKETTRFAGGADLATQTFGGSISKLNNRVAIMKAALGETLIPVVGTLTEMLTWVTGKITEFSKESSAMTSIILVGITTVATFGAAIAMLGAMLPMLTSGFVVLNWAVLAPFMIAGLKVTAVLIGISLAMGGLIYLALKASGRWDKWKDTVSSLADKIKAAINPFIQLGDAASDADEKIAKQIKKLEEGMRLATRSYLEDMGKWAAKHDETVKDLKSQIDGLASDYKAATDKIRKSFTDTMSDLTLSHTRKTEDLQREIDEEVSKGIWADQTRIRELKLALKRENEDYALSSKEKGQDRDDDLEDEKDKLDERLTKLQEELDKELELERNNAELVAMARMQPFLDELKEKTRAYEERMTQYQEELAEIQETSTQGADALSGITTAYSDISDAQDVVFDNVDYMGNKIREDMLKTKTVLGSLGLLMEDWSDSLYRIWADKISPMIMSTSDKAYALWQKIKPKITSGILGLSDLMYNEWKSAGHQSYQEGGVIPGATNQAVPIMAHGGETVLPAGASPITININNPSVREAQDIYRIADAVKQVISREQVLKHYQ